MASPTKPSGPAVRITCSLSSSNSTVAPSARNPFRWRSIGRFPMEHPPGIGITHLPQRASSGPITMVEARISLTSSESPTVVLISFAVTEITPGDSSSTSAPKLLSISRITFTSAKSGTSSIRQVSPVKRVAAINGRTAFFAPLICTVP